MPIVILLTLLLSTLGHTTMTVGNVDCPEQFDGRVEKIIKSSSIKQYDTQAVIFKNLMTLKGEVAEQVSVEMLTNGPFLIEKGEGYRIQLRDGRVCWIEKI